MLAASSRRQARYEIVIGGLVQGVGFRPFVYRLASRLGLSGFVRNQQARVIVDVEGDPDDVERFVAALVEAPPPLARVEQLTRNPLPLAGARGFHIQRSDGNSDALESRGDEPDIVIAPDLATCADCLRELLDPRDRRHRYPFANCSQCGPRLTIIEGTPYDRARTTMAPFIMCAACRAEYEDPRDRRFHAQPTACADCGPQLTLTDANGAVFQVADAVAESAARLRSGAIAAVKGLGGYHLACLAADGAAVRELRRRKHRDRKPFAVMFATIEDAARAVELGPDERRLLQSAARPIVLALRRAHSEISDDIAPGLEQLGVLLPYTPLHHLLLADLGGAPLVMTSGNASDEPIAFEDADARARLDGIADFFVTHDRAIRVRCDDSVARVAGGVTLWLRRSRGCAPSPLELPSSLTLPTLALGGELKSTFALGAGRRATLSHHLGDLEHYAAFCAFGDAVARYQRCFGVTPRRLVHDLHPDYASTRYARERAAAESLPLLAVQHHHAHFASCLAEHAVAGRAIGVIFDGHGLGSDGSSWGGEFLVGDCAGFVRAAHLAEVRLPGGERAIREPWRMAAAHLIAARRGLDLLAARIPAPSLRAVTQLIERGLCSPQTSSVGRLFDAVAALLLGCDSVGFEAEAALRLESLATRAAPESPYPFDLRDHENGALVADAAPLIAAVADDLAAGVAAARIARRFHAALAQLVLEVCLRLRARFSLDVVALSGGVFANAILSADSARLLGGAGFTVLRQQRVPSGDGGLSLGQLAIAAARDAKDPPCASASPAA